jgi:hypothetical protein
MEVAQVVAIGGGEPSRCSGPALRASSGTSCSAKPLLSRRSCRRFSPLDPGFGSAGSRSRPDRGPDADAPKPSGRSAVGAQPTRRTRSATPALSQGSVLVPRRWCPLPGRASDGSGSPLDNARASRYYGATSMATLLMQGDGRGTASPTIEVIRRRRRKCVHALLARWRPYAPCSP